MTTTTYFAKGVITSSCTCYHCPSCEMTFTDDTYPENCDCGTPCTPAYESCSGECWDFATEDFAYNAFTPWCLANETDEFAVYGRRMGWTNGSGHTGRLTAFRELLNNLTLNGDFILRWELSEDNKTLTVVRSSHDEMGAMFEVVPWNEGDDE